MWSEGTGDTSGYGGIVREIPFPRAATQPFGSWYDQVHDRLATLVTDPFVKVVIDRGEITFYIPREKLAESGMTPLSALSMMVFVLLYLPCLATTTAIRRETGSTGASARVKMVAAIWTLERPSARHCWVRAASSSFSYHSTSPLVRW